MKKWLQSFLFRHPRIALAFLYAYSPFLFFGFFCDFFGEMRFVMRDLWEEHWRFYCDIREKIYSRIGSRS